MPRISRPSEKLAEHSYDEKDGEKDPDSGHDFNAIAAAGPPFCPDPLRVSSETGVGRPPDDGHPHRGREQWESLAPAAGSSNVIYSNAGGTDFYVDLDSADSVPIIP
jgi:hypothetical protein